MATTKKTAKKKVAKKTAKKTNGKKTTVTAAGHKGHRVGTAKEQLHIIFDKYGDKQLDKAKELAAKVKTTDGKLVSAATINTSFSQFRTQA